MAGWSFFSHFGLSHTLWKGDQSIHQDPASAHHRSNQIRRMWLPGVFCVCLRTPAQRRRCHLWEWCVRKGRNFPFWASVFEKGETFLIWLALGHSSTKSSMQDPQHQPVERQRSSEYQLMKFRNMTDRSRYSYSRTWQKFDEWVQENEDLPKNVLTPHVFE